MSTVQKTAIPTPTANLCPFSRPFLHSTYYIWGGEAGLQVFAWKRRAGFDYYDSFVTQKIITMAQCTQVQSCKCSNKQRNR